MTKELPKLLSPGEVAKIFNVAVTTVTRWAKRGQMPSMRTLGGHRRYRVEDVQAFLKAGWK